MGLRGVGLFLPTFAAAGGRTGEELAAFARRAEDLGFDSVWATDHLLHQSRFYAVPWLDPIVSLTYVAAATSRLRLGTSVLVLPTRQPVVLAKQIATLQALADERYILGVGTGWDDREFQAVGQRRAERGGRTDESIAILRRLLAGESVTYEGRFYQLRNVAVGPAMRSPLRLWTAGGRQLPHAASPERPVPNRRATQRGDAHHREVARVVNALRRIVRAIHQSHRLAEQRWHLSSAQLLVLQRLAESPALSVNELADRTFTHQSTVSVVVTRLVRRGLVRRSRAGHDARRAELQLTAPGRLLLDRAMTSAQGQLIDALDAMSAARLGAIEVC